ncbi:MAG: CPBP family intramembrane glutamic endopeptidase [Spirochaetota bacterium]|nr:CPBP family intramembrane glutamic endopeptidase [Spirochaetota bacterium]
MLKLLHHYTIKQWQKINKEYIDKDLQNRIDSRAIIVFLLFTFVLVSLKYFGKSPTFYQLFGNYFQVYPYPGIYSNLYWAFFRVCVYFIIPVMVIKCMFKENIRDYGFRTNRSPRVMLLYVVMFVAVFPLVYIASKDPGFLRTYPFYKHAANTWTELVLWESAYALQFLTLEFFFRGFILFSFSRYIGAYSILLMSVPYTMIHFQKPFPETLGAIIAGMFLGTLALRTRSIFGGVIIHVAVAWSMDITAMFQKGQLQRLF